MTESDCRAPRIAVNPIQYWAKAGRTKAVLEVAFAELSAIGYTAVKADVPDGMSSGDYLDWLGGYGLSPAVSLFNSAFDESIDISAETERAKRFAGVQVELGLDRTMVSSVAIPARFDRPAIGTDFNADRLALAIENCGVICQVLQSEGLRPLHHSHVGGVFETEEEITSLLDELGPDVIGVGADTGHLRWAGIEPAAFISRYADRVGALHLKDCFTDHLDGRGGQAGYHELSETKRLWAEPGLGVIDFAAVLAALPADFDGDLMIEVDEPSVATPRESHQISYDWAIQRLRR
ncbi:MAG: sugar phosphate isomerase/epimerase [Microlunatus sp.]